MLGINTTLLAPCLSQKRMHRFLSKHSPQGFSEILGKTLSIKKRCLKHSIPKSCPYAGEVLNVRCECHGFVYIVIKVFGNPIRLPSVVCYRFSVMRYEAITFFCYDWHAHPQCLCACRHAVVGESIQRDIDPVVGFKVSSV